ncbi:MAG: proline reductase-associated electron transfer protein PrdC [Bifidobacterium psychraerophilum]|uniref:proline reductase-associated electron transfer protein PrdC n=1 Tax=Bifidobacterium psychraerophilum TaxID=218140 RepID=UPI0039E7A41D
MDRNYHVIAASSLFDAAPARMIPDSLAVLDRIRESGLVGMGGAGFPTWKKLSFGKGSDVIIANAAECEPLLEHNVARLRSNPGEILSGITLAMRQTGASKGIIAIKAKHTESLDAVRAALSAAGEGSSAFDIDPGIEIALLQDRYPAGDERAIVRDVLGTLVEPNEIPSKAGAVVINVETLLRLHQAVVERKAVNTKDITVAGDITGSGFGNDVSLVLYDVPIGKRVADVLDALGIRLADDARLLMGGPYMGGEITAEDCITATSGGVIIAGSEIQDEGPMGIIVCACGASEERLKAIVREKGSSLCGVEFCKNAFRLPNGRLKCRNPGICPGQTQAVLALRKKGAQSVLIGHCTDCSNTVMQVAPKLGMRVHHATDAYMRAGGEHLIRSFRKTTVNTQA